MRRSARFLVFMGVMCLLLCVGGQLPSAIGPKRVAADVLAPTTMHRTYLPMIARDYLSPENRLCRFGIGAPSDIVRYPVNQLRIGWYLDWGASLNPARPGGIAYLQTLRLHQTGSDSYTSSPQGSDLLGMIAANPHSLWLIGNEPDRRIWQDDIEPHVYAKAYHELYDQIKTADPTARIVAGNIVQPTPLRLQYLDMVLASYQATYKQPMPVDVWNIHAFILNEVSCDYDPTNCWGADVPPGINAPYGIRYDIQDNDSLVIFKQFIVDFRQWMADRGYQERPLIITEYGVLMPTDYGFPPSRVNAYMNGTFDFLSTATGPTGFSADKGRLVQAWAWYSLADQNFNGWLYNSQTKARSPYGDNFAGYTALVAPAVNLTPIKIWAEPVGGASMQTVTLVAEVSSNGNIAMPGGARVRFYRGDPDLGGTLIGSDQIIPAMDGCGAVAQAKVTWAGVPNGTTTVWVVVDPLNEIPENDETDNRLSIPITVGP
jgi:hypothetical protein